MHGVDLTHVGSSALETSIYRLHSTTIDLATINPLQRLVADAVDIGYMTAGLMRTRLPSSLFRPRHAVTGAASRVVAHAPAIAGSHVWTRSFARVQDPEILSDQLWFSSTAPRPRPDGVGSGGDHKPPDERTLKLGKSEELLIRISTLYPAHLADMHNSCPDPPRAPPNAVGIAIATRHSLATNIPTSLSLDTPSSAHCLGTYRLSSCSVDLSISMGPCSGRWQCEAHHYIRAHGSQWRDFGSTWLAGREADSQVEDVRQDQR